MKKSSIGFFFNDRPIQIHQYKGRTKAGFKSVASPIGRAFKRAIFAFVANDFENATICPLLEQGSKIRVLSGVFFPQNGGTGVDPRFNP
ncbi:hypothetical protein ACKFKG_16165 [Phormidesmis sp. 146-35]